MKIGLISDSHDNIPLIKKAVDAFNARKAEFVLHAGDYIALFAVDALKGGLSCPFKGVYGNNDGEKQGLAKISKGNIVDPPLELELAGKKIFIAHSLENVETKMDEKKYDLILYGHSHKLDIKKKNGVLAVNPGECGGWLYGKSTVVMLDLSNMETEVIEL